MGVLIVMNFEENILKRRPGINCSDKALQYDEMNDKTKESLCVAWMKLILDNWDHKFEFAEEVSKQFGFNVFEEFKKLIDTNEKLSEDDEKFLLSLNRKDNEVILFEKGSDIDLVKFVLSNLEDATLVFNGLNPICDKLNELYHESEKLKEENISLNYSLANKKCNCNCNDDSDSTKLGLIKLLFDDNYRILAFKAHHPSDKKNIYVEVEFEEK